MKKDSKLTNRDTVPATAIQSVCTNVIWITANNYAAESTMNRPTTDSDEMTISSVLFGNCFCKFASIRFMTRHVQTNNAKDSFSLSVSAVVAAKRRCSTPAIRRHTPHCAILFVKSFKRRHDRWNPKRSHREWFPRR